MFWNVQVFPRKFLILISKCMYFYFYKNLRPFFYIYIYNGLNLLSLCGVSMHFVSMYVWRRGGVSSPGSCVGVSIPGLLLHTKGGLREDGTEPGRDVFADVIDLVSVLSRPPRAVLVRLVLQDLHSAALTAALLSALLLQGGRAMTAQEERHVQIHQRGKKEMKHKNKIKFCHVHSVIESFWEVLCL